MDDEFLHTLRTTPPEGFASDLRARLERQARDDHGAPARSKAWRFAALGAAAVLGVALFAFAPVRASAQAFLNLFRVADFAAVPVDVDRLSRVNVNGLDIPHLIGQQIEATDPGAPRVYVTPGEAAAAAGLTLALPQVVPTGLTVIRTEVEGARSARVTGDARKLQDVLDALGITDEEVPPGLDGQVATLRVPPIVRMVYASGTREISFLQSRSPEVELPAGLDPVGLGRIAFRIAGLGRDEAHTLAQAIDWRTTLVVPVPAGVSSFRQVEVGGSRGLLLQATDKPETKALVWSRNGIVYGLMGRLNDEAMLLMATSVQ